MAPLDRSFNTDFIHYIETGFGYVPIFTSKVLDQYHQGMAFGCSQAFEIRILDGMQVKEASTDDFSREGLVGAFVSSCLFNEEAVVYWTPNTD